MLIKILIIVAIAVFAVIAVAVGLSNKKSESSGNNAVADLHKPSTMLKDPVKNNTSKGISPRSDSEEYQRKNNDRVSDPINVPKPTGGATTGKVSEPNDAPKMEAANTKQTDPQPLTQSLSEIKANNLPWPSHKMTAKAYEQLQLRYLKGDSSACDELISILTGDDEEFDKELALSFLLSSNNRKGTRAVINMLVSDNMQLRAAAFHQLPEKYRPSDYNYQLAPTDEMRKKVAALLTAADGDSSLK